MGKRSSKSSAIPPPPPDTEARIRVQEAEMKRQISDGTFESDAMTAEELERKLLG